MMVYNIKLEDIFKNSKVLECQLESSTYRNLQKKSYNLKNYTVGILIK